MNCAQSIKFIIWVVMIQSLSHIRTMGQIQGSPPKSSDFVVLRKFNKPIITPDLDPSIGTNINGPSLIRTPKWLRSAPGKYLLYFAHHNGKSIRLAYADDLKGPWKVVLEGALQIDKSYFSDHVASPCAVIDDAAKEIRLYYHGLTPSDGGQHTRVAVSKDGVHFVAQQEPVQRNSAYWKLFKHDSYWYALAMPGKLFRSQKGLDVFEPGRQLFPNQPTFIHCGILQDGDNIFVFYTRAGDSPESILVSKVSTKGPWSGWSVGPPQIVLSPEKDYEGADLPPKPATIGAVDQKINSLRDPDIFVDEGHIYLLYAIAGESGIGIVEIVSTKPIVHRPEDNPAVTK